MRDRLYRSRDDRMLFGVAGGLARYLGLDPAIVRLVWVLLFFAAGTGILLYLIAAIVIPEERAGSASASAATRPVLPVVRGDSSGAIVLGLILVAIGGWFLVQRLVPELDGRLLWPFVLIGLGALLVGGALRRRS
jgi:phage shock protein C